MSNLSNLRSFDLSRIRTFIFREDIKVSLLELVIREELHSSIIITYNKDSWLNVIIFQYIHFIQVLLIFLRVNDIFRISLVFASAKSHCYWFILPFFMDWRLINCADVGCLCFTIKYEYILGWKYKLGAIVSAYSGKVYFKFITILTFFREHFDSIKTYGYSLVSQNLKNGIISLFYRNLVIGVKVLCFVFKFYPLFITILNHHGWVISFC